MHDFFKYLINKNIKELNSIIKELNKSLSKKKKIKYKTLIENNYVKRLENESNS